MKTTLCMSNAGEGFEPMKTVGETEQILRKLKELKSDIQDGRVGILFLKPPFGEIMGGVKARFLRVICMIPSLEKPWKKMG